MLCCPVRAHAAPRHGPAHRTAPVAVSSWDRPECRGLPRSFWTKKPFHTNKGNNIYKQATFVTLATLDSDRKQAGDSISASTSQPPARARAAASALGLSAASAAGGQPKNNLCTRHPDVPLLCLPLGGDEDASGLCLHHSCK